MQQLHPDIWVSDSPLRFLGLEVGARMTVVRLSDGRTLLHSPISPTPEVVREVEAIGPVAYLVAPNKLHHLFVGEWLEAFPNALLYTAPGLEKKRSDLKAAGVLGDEAEPGWADVLDQVRVEGFSFANEIVFFHRPSRTLILTDLAFNVGSCSPPLTRLFFRMAGAYEKVTPTPIERLLIRDQRAFRRSLERILEWPFERVIVSHGEVSESGGREELVAGYSWILEGS